MSNISMGISPLLLAAVLLAGGAQAQNMTNQNVEPAAEAAPKTSDWTPTPPSERRVGIAYTTWHRNAQWDNTWGTPLDGAYASDNRAVIDRHARQLQSAGVDFAWVDWSNDIGYVYDPNKKRPDFDMIEGATFTLFDEWARLRSQGEKTPNISIFLGVTLVPAAAEDGRLQEKADKMWNQFVANPVYRPLVEMDNGKPLLVVYVNTPSPFQKGVPKWDDSRFTVRWMTGYVTQQGALHDGEISKYGYWSWEDRGPQTFPIVDGHPEAMVINAATRKQGKPGEAGYIPPAPRDNGATFRKSWARAREIGPKYAMVVSWNEWHKGEQPSAEVSKDIEPSKEFGNQYLDILREEISAFKAGK